MNQADASNTISAARTTITAIEKGNRKIKPEELIKLASAYGKRVSDFVRPRPKIVPFQVQFRGPYKVNNEDKKKINESIYLLEELARNYLELDQITNNHLSKKYPEIYGIKGLPIDSAAEGVASQERNRLGLGDGPIPLLRDILEQEVGLRIFYLPIKPSKFSAIYLYDHNLGGCIAVNSNHPEERRRLSLAHDYGHFLSNRYVQKLYIAGIYQRIPENEQFADYFALYFLKLAGKLSIGLFPRFNSCREARLPIVSGIILSRLPPSFNSCREVRFPIVSGNAIS